MILCNEWKEAEETIEVSYNLLEDWGEIYQAQVSISNNSETEINCWKLGFNLTGSISEIWDSVLLSEENGTVIVSNNETNSTIAPENKANFSFIAKKNKDETPELSDFILYENYINIEKSFEEIVPEIMGYADFSEDLLTINWYSTIEDGKFEVLKSLDNETFEVIEELENEKSYKYGEIDFEKAYFKIRQTLSDGRTAESAAVAVVYENAEFKWEYIDTDEEGIPDIYEESIGTDITNPDTDGDNLTDYEEIYLTNSDPLVYNSVNEEVSDSEADPDEDGVSNRTEIDNGTNPLLADSDYDGINDGEEAKIGTDPVSSDTDNDGIADGDELTLNLDPTSDTTDGIKDNERTTLQEIEADSEIMSEINTDENPMKVSIEFEAAGLAESSLDVSESGYSSAMSNSAIVGAIPEFSYPEGLSTGEVTVKFSVDESVKENTLGTYAEECEELKGIKRFNVFKYFEDTNMLLPIETFHDEEKGVIYTKTDCLGTYCVMDLELWMQNLGVEATTEELTETVDVSYLSAEETKDESKDEKRNIVFHLDTRKKAVTDEDYEEMKTLVKDICKDVYDNIGAVNIFLSSGDGDKLQLLNHDGYTDEIADYVPNTSIDVDNGYFNVTNVLKNIKDRMEEDFEGKTLVFLVCDNKSVVGSRSLSASLLKGLSIMYNVHVSFISKDMVAKEYSYVESIRKTSSAFIFNDFSVGEIKNYIYTEFEPTQFKIITANNYETVKLDSILRKDSKTDTDSDDLSDWNEINVELIEHFNSGATDKGYLTMDDMPNLVQIINHPQKPYVQSGLDRLKSSTDEPYWQWWDEPVVPIISVPVDADGDNDGAIDRDDKEPLNEFFDEPIYEIEDKCKFNVLTVFKEPVTGVISSNAVAYSMPLINSEKISDLFVEEETVNAVAIILSESLYWIKIRLENGLYVYIHNEDMIDYDKLGVVFDLKDRNVINIPEDYKYLQTGDNDYGYKFPKKACACFSYATALSIIFNRAITPDLIDADNNGYINSFNFNVCLIANDNGEYRYEKITDSQSQNEKLIMSAKLQRYYSSSGFNYSNMCSDQEKVWFEIDQILANSNYPIMFHIYIPNTEEEHWVIIIGKENGIYQIYDPYLGEIGNIDTTMQYYRKYTNKENFRYEYGVIKVLYG